MISYHICVDNIFKRAKTHYFTKSLMVPLISIKYKLFYLLSIIHFLTVKCFTYNYLTLTAKLNSHAFPRKIKQFNFQQFSLPCQQS